MSHVPHFILRISFPPFYSASSRRNKTSLGFLVVADLQQVLSVSSVTSHLPQAQLAPAFAPAPLAGVFFTEVEHLGEHLRIAGGMQPWSCRDSRSKVITPHL